LLLAMQPESSTVVRLITTEKDWISEKCGQPRNNNIGILDSRRDRRSPTDRRNQPTLERGDFLPPILKAAGPSDAEGVRDAVRGGKMDTEFRERQGDWPVHHRAKKLVDYVRTRKELEKGQSRGWKLTSIAPRTGERGWPGV